MQIPIPYGRNYNPFIIRTPQPADSDNFLRYRREREFNEEIEDEFDKYEIFDIIRNISDPEHPNLTLEQLNIVHLELITIENSINFLEVLYRPTIPNCINATLIGLMIRVKLHRSLPTRFKIDVKIQPGKSDNIAEINKQLNDKERVLAALENPNLRRLIN